MFLSEHPHTHSTHIAPNQNQGVAVKVITKAKLSKRALRALENEHAIMAKVRMLWGVSLCVRVCVCVCVCVSQCLNEGWIFLGVFAVSINVLRYPFSSLPCFWLWNSR
jgi:hypothetical protein